MYLILADLYRTGGELPWWGWIIFPLLVLVVVIVLALVLRPAGREQRLWDLRVRAWQGDRDAIYWLKEGYGEDRPTTDPRERQPAISPPAGSSEKWGARWSSAAWRPRLEASGPLVIPASDLPPAPPRTEAITPNPDESGPSPA